MVSINIFKRTSSFMLSLFRARTTRLLFTLLLLKLSYIIFILFWKTRKIHRASNLHESLGSTLSNQSKPEKLSIMISAYRRGGSTVTGELFASHPDTFYLFEPSVRLSIESQETLWRLEHSASNSDAVIDEALDIYLNIFNCSVGSLPIEMLLNPFIFMKHYKGIKSYLQCARHRGLTDYRQYQSCFDNLDEICPTEYVPIQYIHNCYDLKVKARNNYVSHESNKMGNNTFLQYYDCLRQSFDLIRPCIAMLELSCRNAQLRVVKEVWLGLKLPHLLLRRNTNLKIIHLVRDPRGLLMSRLSSENGVLTRSIVAFTCSEMVSDLKTFELITREFPSAALQVRYEDVVLRPKTVARTIFRFLGLSEAAGAEYFHSWMSNINTKTPGVFAMIDTYRRNSAAEAYDWLGKDDNQGYREIFESIPECVSVIEQLGYPDTLNWEDF